MFTGIIEEAGQIARIERHAQGIRLEILTGLVHQGTRKGDSIAVNGCCLTLVASRKQGRKSRLAFDLLEETWKRTGFAQLREGKLVNLERALLANGRLDGHFVTGHVDGTGKVTKWERTGNDWILEIKAPSEVSRYLVPKGSITVDGISLTVAAVRAGTLRIFIIPHTLQVTNLRERAVGDAVNLEADILGKYVVGLLRK